jgi:hypothetical protein
MFQRTLRRLKRPPQLFAGPPDNFNESSVPTTFALSNPPASSTPRVITAKTFNDYTPSPKVLAFAAQHNIGFPSHLRRIFHRDAAKYPFLVSISDRQTFHFFHLNYLTRFGSALTDKTLYHYEQMARERPLWCYIQGTSSTDNSIVVVRRASERMVRAALFKAMNSLGYDAFGRPCQMEGNTKTKREPLRGTLRIMISTPKKALQVDFEEMVEYFQGVVVMAAKKFKEQATRVRAGHFKNQKKGAS